MELKNGGRFAGYKIVDSLIFHAILQNASDIHIEPRKGTDCPLSDRRHIA